MTNQERRQLLERFRASGMEGSILDVYKAHEQGIDLIEEHQRAQQQNQPVPIKQPNDLREFYQMSERAGDLGRQATLKSVPPNTPINTNGAVKPMNIRVSDPETGHLIESYDKVPPGISDISTGSYTGDVLIEPTNYRDGGEKKPAPRKGARDNMPLRNAVFGTYPNEKSTHLYRAETIGGGKWVAFPTLFQNEDGSWVDMSVDSDKNWGPAYQEALKRNEVINFGEDAEEAIKFALGSWKRDKDKREAPGMAGVFKQMKETGGFIANANPEVVNNTTTSDTGEVKDDGLPPAMDFTQDIVATQDNLQEIDYMSPQAQAIEEVGLTNYIATQTFSKIKQIEEERQKAFESGPANATIKQDNRTEAERKEADAAFEKDQRRRELIEQGVAPNAAWMRPNTGMSDEDLATYQVDNPITATPLLPILGGTAVGGVALNPAPLAQGVMLAADVGFATDALIRTPDVIERAKRGENVLMDAAMIGLDVAGLGLGLQGFGRADNLITTKVAAEQKPTTELFGFFEKSGDTGKITEARALPAAETIAKNEARTRESIRQFRTDHSDFETWLNRNYPDLFKQYEQNLEGMFFLENRGQEVLTQMSSPEGKRRLINLIQDTRREAGLKPLTEFQANLIAETKIANARAAIENNPMRSGIGKMIRHFEEGVTNPLSAPELFDPKSAFWGGLTGTKTGSKIDPITGVAGEAFVGRSVGQRGASNVLEKAMITANSTLNKIIGGKMIADVDYNALFRNLDEDPAFGMFKWRDLDSEIRKALESDPSWSKLSDSQKDEVMSIIEENYRGKSIASYDPAGFERNARAEIGAAKGASPSSQAGTVMVSPGQNRVAVDNRAANPTEDWYSVVDHELMHAIQGASARGSNIDAIGIEMAEWGRTNLPDEWLTSNSNALIVINDRGATRTTSPFELMIGYGFNNAQRGGRAAGGPMVEGLSHLAEGRSHLLSRGVLSNRYQTITKEMLQKAAEEALLEIQRVFPDGPKVVQDLTQAQIRYAVDKGTRVFLSLEALRSNPKLYDDYLNKLVGWFNRTPGLVMPAVGVGVTATMMEDPFAAVEEESDI